MSVHSRPTWYIEESRKSYCNKGSGQQRLPDLPSQVKWRRDVNFFRLMEREMKQTQHSESMAMRVQNLKKNAIRRLMEY